MCGGHFGPAYFKVATSIFFNVVLTKVIATCCQPVSLPYTGPKISTLNLCQAPKLEGGGLFQLGAYTVWEVINASSFQNRVVG